MLVFVVQSKNLGHILFLTFQGAQAPSEAILPNPAQVCPGALWLRFLGQLKVRGTKTCGNLMSRKILKLKVAGTFIVAQNSKPKSRGN